MSDNGLWFFSADQTPIFPYTKVGVYATSVKIFMVWWDYAICIEK